MVSSVPSVIYHELWRHYQDVAQFLNVNKPHTAVNDKFILNPSIQKHTSLYNTLPGKENIMLMI